jgi:hypothetical protein
MAETPLQKARELKSQAIEQRELKEYNASEALLTSAIRLLTDCLHQIERYGKDSADAGDLSEKAGPSEREIAKELAHLYGSLGGTYRAWRRFDQAAAAYDQGYAFESNKRYDLVNSYNLTQRLVNRVLLDPGTALGGQEEIKGLRFPDALERARAEIEMQLRGSRKDDQWALADLALVCLLLGSDDQLEVWSELEEKATTAYVFEALRNVVNDLHQECKAVAQERSTTKAFQDIFSRLSEAQQELAIR